MKFSAVLFCIGWMSVVVSGDERPSDCCLSVSETRIPAENIVKYDIQETQPCPVRAVRFLTKKSKTICSDPESKWAKRVMEIVDWRTTTKPKCFISTTNTIPTSTTTSTNKTPGPETETSTSTTAPPEVTSIETPPPKTEISETTSQPTSVSTEKPTSSSSIVTCGTGGPTASPTHKTPGKETVLTTSSKTDNTEIKTATPKRTKPSKLSIKKRRKSRKQLKKYQMNNHQE